MTCHDDSTINIVLGITIIILCASCGTVYCNRSCLFVCGCVCESVITITRNCVHRSSPNWVMGKGSDHLQLIKFWLSRAPGKGVCSGAKFLAPPYYSQRAVFASPLSTFIIIIIIIIFFYPR